MGSASDVTEKGSEIGHSELQCEYFSSHSPPAPPLSCQALFPLSPSFSGSLIPLKPPLLHAHFPPSCLPCFSSSSPNPLSLSFHSPTTSLIRHTHISLKPISLYLFIRHSSSSSLFSILCFSTSLSPLYLFQSSHMWI